MTLLGKMELTVYADDEGCIDPDRVRGLIDQAETLGYVGAPLEYVHPAKDSDTGAERAWGLRIVGIEEGE